MIYYTNKLIKFDVNECPFFPYRAVMVYCIVFSMHTSVLHFISDKKGYASLVPVIIRRVLDNVISSTDITNPVCLSVPNSCIFISCH